jgi:hypothetical protein
MEKRKVEFELDVNKLASYVAVITALGLIAWWFISAHLTHGMVGAMPPPIIQEQQTDLLDSLAKGQKSVNDGIKQLQQEETLRKQLWGESYRKKISRMVDDYDKQNALE